MAAVTGTVIALASAGASFAQAAKQRNLQASAQADAQKALEEARRRTEVNYASALGINKAPYEAKTEALLAQGATGMQAAMEGSNRGVAATAGQLYAAQNQAQEQNRIDYSKDISGLANAVVAEQNDLRNINLNLDIGEIKGSQQAAADAANKAAAATTAGFAQASSGLQQGIQAGVPLFQKQAPPYTGTPLMMQSAANPVAAPPTFDMNAILAPYRPNVPQPYNVQAPFMPQTQQVGINQPQPMMMQGAANQPWNFNPFNYTR